jgi:hypothetical protein
MGCSLVFVVAALAAPVVQSTLAEPAAASSPWAAPSRPVTLGVELAGTAGPGLGGGLVGARVLVNLAPLSIDLSVAEGYLGGVHRQAGRIGIGLRRYVWRGSYLRAAFAHAHESPWGDFTEHVGGSLAGTAAHLHHRSGVEIGAGWLIALGQGRVREHLAFTVDLSTQIYPGALEPRATASLALGLVSHLGKPRRAHDRSARHERQRPVAGG